MVMETYQIRINTKYYLKYFFRWDQDIMIFNLLLVFTLNLTLVYVQIPWMHCWSELQQLNWPPQLKLYLF